jgi:hypothetical protein
VRRGLKEALNKRASRSTRIESKARPYRTEGPRVSKSKSIEVRSIDSAIVHGREKKFDPGNPSILPVEEGWAKIMLGKKADSAEPILSNALTFAQPNQFGCCLGRL